MTGEENPRSTRPGDSGGLCAKTAAAPSHEARLSSHGPSREDLSRRPPGCWPEETERGEYPEEQTPPGDTRGRRPPHENCPRPERERAQSQHRAHDSRPWSVVPKAVGQGAQDSAQLKPLCSRSLMGPPGEWPSRGIPPKERRAPSPGGGHVPRSGEIWSGSLGGKRRHADSGSGRPPTPTGSGSEKRSGRGTTPEVAVPSRPESSGTVRPTTGAGCQSYPSTVQAVNVTAAGGTYRVHDPARMGRIRRGIREAEELARERHQLVNRRAREDMRRNLLQESSGVYPLAPISVLLYVTRHQELPQEPNHWVENFTDLVNPIVQTLHTQLMEASAGESTGAETVPFGRLLGWIALATQELYRVYQEWLIMADNARIYIAVVREFSNRLRGAIIDVWGVPSAAVGDADSIYLIGFEDLQEKFQRNKRERTLGPYVPPAERDRQLSRWRTNVVPAMGAMAQECLRRRFASRWRMQAALWHGLQHGEWAGEAARRLRFHYDVVTADLRQARVALERGNRAWMSAYLYQVVQVEDGLVDHYGIYSKLESANVHPPAAVAGISPTPAVTRANWLSYAGNPGSPLFAELRQQVVPAEYRPYGEPTQPESRM